MTAAHTLALATLAAAGCATDPVPAQPSWQVDVMPVLAANCVRCHGYPTSGFATPGFRLDSFGPTLLASGDLIGGASTTGRACSTRRSIRRPRCAASSARPIRPSSTST